MSDRGTMEAELVAVQARRENLPPRGRGRERLNERVRILRAGLREQDRLDEWGEVLANRRPRLEAAEGDGQRQPRLSDNRPARSRPTTQRNAKPSRLWPRTLPKSS